MTRNSPPPVYRATCRRSVPGPNHGGAALLKFQMSVSGRAGSSDYRRGRAWPDSDTWSNRQHGFTLVELVVVIVISGILALSVSQLIQRPVEMYQAQASRARLVDRADTALVQISRALRDALPNSIRISNCPAQCALEFLHVLSGGRYRADPVGDPLHLSFNPADADSRFEALGLLPDSGLVQTGTNASDCASMNASCLVIYNTGQAGSDAYNLDNAATITALSGGSPITLNFINSGFSGGQSAFPASSPNQRFYIVDTPVTYLCDTGSGTIRRYEGYNLQASQASVDTHSDLLAQGNPAEAALLVDQVTACNFTYTPGTPSRNALVTLEITVEERGESITLLQQAHLSNMP